MNPKFVIVFYALLIIISISLSNRARACPDADGAYALLTKHYTNYLCKDSPEKLTTDQLIARSNYTMDAHSACAACAMKIDSDHPTDYRIIQSIRASECYNLLLYVIKPALQVRLTTKLNKEQDKEIHSLLHRIPHPEASGGYVSARLPPTKGSTHIELPEMFRGYAYMLDPDQFDAVEGHYLFNDDSLLYYPFELGSDPIDVPVSILSAFHDGIDSDVNVPNIWEMTEEDIDQDFRFITL